MLDCEYVAKHGSAKLAIANQIAKIIRRNERPTTLRHNLAVVFGMAPFAKRLAFGVAVFPRLPARRIMLVMNLQNDVIRCRRTITPSAAPAVKLDDFTAKFYLITMTIKVRHDRRFLARGRS